MKLKEKRQNWNLAENIDYQPIEYEGGVSTSGRITPSTAKKCRDLIIKDLKILDKKVFSGFPVAISKKEVSSIINKRFGDLR